ncbi:MAG: serine hydrolase [Candidatus Solibacter usitatus]|nr:serine hydrolase [Candidatus Solibacter usitatus]
MGFDPKKLQAALAFAMNNESTWNFARDQERTFGKPLGPLPESRAATNVMVIRDGYLVAEFGDTLRPDPVYSVAKSFVSTMAGLAFDRKMIKDLHEFVGKSMRDGGYDSPQNSGITWHHHLQQTSEWEGEMWGKKHDFVGHDAFGAGERKQRALEKPGTHYEYNDVRINRFSLSLLKLWNEPLPSVLKRLVMDPIGASSNWTWHGYSNSTVEIAGKKATSVPGGTRWGGGLWISSRDLARFGLLFLNKGNWEGKQLLSENWIQQAITPGVLMPNYGYLWWLGAMGKRSFSANGAGSNIVAISPEHRMVVVWRWFRGQPGEFFKMLTDSLTG